MNKGSIRNCKLHHAISWCWKNNVFIYPIRLDTPLEVYNICVVNNGKETTSKTNYYANKSKQGESYDSKIKELYITIFNKNKSK